MNKFLEPFVRNTVFANLLLAFFIISGIMSTTQMVREMFPSMESEMVLVRVPYPGAGPEEVEEGISLKVEDAIEGLTGIKRYTTKSAEGISVTNIEIKEGEDLQEVKDRIADKVNAINTFPDDAERPTISEMEIRRDTLVIAVAGDLPEEQLKELGEDIRDELLDLPSISDVELQGTRAYEISIEVSEETLRRYGLTFQQITDIVRQSSLNLPGGELRSEDERISIRAMGRNYTGKEYGEIVLIAGPNGASVRLRDIAQIHDSFVEDNVITRYNGVPAVTLTVYNGEDEDAIRIANTVQKFVDSKNRELKKMGLENVELCIYLDNSRFIIDRINLLLKNGLVGLILVFALLTFFLDLRLAFWVSLGIPVSFSGALLLMWLVGESINMISLFGLIMVLGIVVDDAIIVGEAIYFHRSHGKGPIEAAVAGTREVAIPVLAAITTTCVAFVPLFYVKGIMGEFISVIPTVVICALLVSLIESIFILPAHLNEMPDTSHKEEPKNQVTARITKIRTGIGNMLDNVINKHYRRFLRSILSWRYVSLAGLLAILMITMGLIHAGLIKFLFFPDIDTAFLTARIEYPEGTPLSVTRGAVLQLEDGLEEIARDYNENHEQDLIVAMESNIGMSKGMDTIGGTGQGSGANIGEIRVELLDPEDRNIHFRDLIQDWRNASGGFPGAVSVVIEGMSGGPPGKPIEVWLLGNNITRMQEAANELKEHLETYAGVFQIEDDFRPGKRELRFRLKPEARNLGLTLAMLAQQVRSGFYGDEVVRVQRGRDEVKVWVRYPREERQTINEIASIRIRTPNGDEVPLGSVADVVLEPGYTTITRVDSSRRISVSADVFTEINNPTEILANLQEEFLPGLMAKYPGIDYTLEGENRQSQESFSSLIVGFPVAVLGMFLIIATVFRSYLQPLIILVTVPFGIIGAVWGHMALGFDLTIMSMFGVVALAGVVVNDAIVLIEAVNDRLAHGMTFDDALVDGGARRFRAIVLTSATTIGGLTPLIVEPSFQAQFLIPMALTLASGVAFATILTLAIIPCLLFILNDMRRGWFRLKKGYWPTCEEVEPATSRVTHQDTEKGQVPGGEIATPAG